MSQKLFVAKSKQLKAIFEEVDRTRTEAFKAIRKLCRAWKPLDIGISDISGRFAVNFYENPDKKVFVRSSNRRDNRWYEPRYGSELRKAFDSIRDGMVRISDAEKLIGYEPFHENGDLFFYQLRTQKIGDTWYFSTHKKFDGCPKHCRRVSDLQYESALKKAGAR